MAGRAKAKRHGKSTHHTGPLIQPRIVGVPVPGPSAYLLTPAEMARLDGWLAAREAQPVPSWSFLGTDFQAGSD